MLRVLRLLRASAPLRLSGEKQQRAHFFNYGLYRFYGVHNHLCHYDYQLLQDQSRIFRTVRSCFKFRIRG